MCSEPSNAFMIANSQKLSHFWVITEALYTTRCARCGAHSALPRGYMPNVLYIYAMYICIIRSDEAKFLAPSEASFSVASPGANSNWS